MSGKSISERFWSKVDAPDDESCWEWMSSKNNKGYGMFSVYGGQRLAHRMSWELSRGDIGILDNGSRACVLHRCDNPSCVNPSHLFLGSQMENISDMHAKGRASGGSMIGSSHPMSKLTDGHVRDIFFLKKNGCAQKRIAMLMRVSESTISDIFRGRTWSHLGLSMKESA